MDRWIAKDIEQAQQMAAIGRRIWKDRHWYVTNEKCEGDQWAVVAA